MRISILYKHMPHYRVDFFNGLRDALAEKGVGLDLFYGKSLSVPKRDEVDLGWGHAVPTRMFGIGTCSVCWQDVPERIFNSDLIILFPENRIVSNHIVLARAKAKHRRVALWGHGVNHQAPRHSVGNFVKAAYETRVSWWFAYTEGVKRHLARMGFATDRITVVQNAIDTRSLQNRAAQIDGKELRALRASIGIGDGPVGLFCGGMYKEKRLPFMLSACHEIRKAVPGFEMLFIGAGPLSRIVADAARRFDWIHYIGPKFRADVVPFMQLADVFMMPGAVGLGILDAFALQKPFITTSYPYHGPEIEYLVNDANGVMTENSLGAFTAGVIRLLSSEELRTQIRAGCREAALTYTVERMVENYVGGVERALRAG